MYDCMCVHALYYYYYYYYYYLGSFILNVQGHLDVWKELVGHKRPTIPVLKA